MLSTAITLAAETSEHGEPAVHPYVIGAIALGLLLVLLEPTFRARSEQNSSSAFDRPKLSCRSAAPRLSAPSLNGPARSSPGRPWRGGRVSASRAWRGRGTCAAWATALH